MVRRVGPRKVYRKIGTGCFRLFGTRNVCRKAGERFNGVGVLEDASGFEPDVRSRLLRSTPTFSTALNSVIERHGKRALRDAIELLHVVERCV